MTIINLIIKTTIIKIINFYWNNNNDLYLTHTDGDNGHIAAVRGHQEHHHAGTGAADDSSLYAGFWI